MVQGEQWHHCTRGDSGISASGGTVASLPRGGGEGGNGITAAVGGCQWHHCSRRGAVASLQQKGGSHIPAPEETVASLLQGGTVASLHQGGTVASLHQRDSGIPAPGGGGSGITAGGGEQ